MEVKRKNGNTERYYNGLWGGKRTRRAYRKAQSYRYKMLAGKCPMN